MWLGGQGGTMRSIIHSAVLVLLVFILADAAWAAFSSDRSIVDMTLVSNASATGAFCLDGSLPAYNLDKGFGSGAFNWLLQFEGGGWCNDLASCLQRSRSYRGSTRYMTKQKVFSGILSNNASLNPDFYNWNRVKIRYCDGASFIGDTQFDNGTNVLYFRGQRIWRAVILDLLSKGLDKANKALLSGCSVGGLASFLHCDDFASMLPENATVKCMSDAGFFVDERDIGMRYTQRLFFEQVIKLQGAEMSLNKDCTDSVDNKALCIFPQYLLRYIKIPFFILNTAYDVYQFHHALVPPSADLPGTWRGCKFDITTCNESQMQTLQGFRDHMLAAVYSFYKNSDTGGMFINSCFAHCQSELQETWLAPGSPKIHNKSIAEAVGDWYFERKTTKEIDCPYPCDRSCYNVISTDAIED